MGEDSLDEASDPGGRAPELAEKSPGLEDGYGLFDEGARILAWDRFTAC